jgi:cysteine sulfinate desulfinase/cysteine desulfurase-like protein
VAAEEIVFTSGGNEANNSALVGSYFALRETGDHIITQATEHPAIHKPLAFLERLGAEVTYLPVDGALRPPRGQDRTFDQCRPRGRPTRGDRERLARDCARSRMRVAQGWVGAPAIQRLRDQFWDRLRADLGNRVALNSHPDHRLPNTLNVSIVGAVGTNILAQIDLLHNPFLRKG